MIDSAVGRLWRIGFMFRLSCASCLVVWHIEKLMLPRVIIIAGFGTPVNLTEVKWQSCAGVFNVEQSLGLNQMGGNLLECFSAFKED